MCRIATKSQIKIYRISYISFTEFHEDERIEINKKLFFKKFPYYFATFAIIKESLLISRIEALVLQHCVSDCSDLSLEENIKKGWSGTLYR